MKQLFDQKQVSRLAGISESQVRYWDNAGLIPHVQREKGKLFFDFQGLVAFRTIKALLDQGASLGKIRKCLAGVRSLLPDLEQPLSEVRVTIQGDQIIFGKDNQAFTPEGQMLIKFEADDGSTPAPPVDPAEELFFQGLAGEELGEWEQAREKYEAGLTLKPEYPNALVNLGNLLNRLALGPAAEWAYRKALYLNPDHPEANYNLASIFEERGVKPKVKFIPSGINNIAELPFKCPVAPLEFAFMADWYFTVNGVRSNIEIELVTPLGAAFTKPVAAGILGNICEQKNIKVTTNYQIASVDGEKKTIKSYGGDEVPYDLLVAIPPNFGAQCIIDSGQTAAAS